MRTDQPQSGLDRRPGADFERGDAAVIADRVVTSARLQIPRCALLELREPFRPTEGGRMPAFATFQNFFLTGIDNTRYGRT